nr:RNA-directed DNA polymerase, eukaryota [Tanacetum cinerariifolium]
MRMVLESQGETFTAIVLQVEYDAVFIDEWSDSNLRGIIQMLHCFSLVSGFKINLQKSNLLGVGVASNLDTEAAGSIGCSVMKAPFKYLGVMVGGKMSKINAWDDMVGKIKSRLSKWKINTLSIGGRLTLLKSVLGSTPIFSMSLYKVPKTMLHVMESLRRDFFNGVQGDDRKISWVKWSKVLASKKYGVLGVSSFYALNRAVLFRWVHAWFLYPDPFFLSLFELDVYYSGRFCLKHQDARDLVDEVLLPKENVSTRCIKSIPIKVNVFAWKLYLDRLPT